jgi:hypothetical protein
MPLLGAPQEGAEESRAGICYLLVGCSVCPLQRILLCKILPKENKIFNGVPPWNSRGFAAGHPTAGCAVGRIVPASVGQGFLIFRFL